jgi:hypothetical protein
MPNLLSFPFRIGANGSAVTWEQDTAEYYAELIGILIATRLGERVQVPSFGVSDPTFAALGVPELIDKTEVFGPPVRIISVTETTVSATEQDVRVEFTPLEADDEAAAFADL